jgi:trehalose 6-phosphate synthase/phosphatase
MKEYEDDVGENEWKELFHVKDWTWKESALKILEGFTEKTEGSFIMKKEVIIAWYYRDCDIYFGHIQANEINTHLLNIFENCKIDIVHGKGYVEIKPKNVNKGYFVSHIIKHEFINKQEPDFIFSVGDDISDEEMFKYLNSVNNQLTYFKENIKVFSCTIGRKPSSAKYYFNEVYEVLEYLESLNQTHNTSFKKDKRRLPQRLHSDNLSLNLFKNFKSEHSSSPSFINLNTK